LNANDDAANVKNNGPRRHIDWTSKAWHGYSRSG
jgi:hypothetical protein